MPSGMHKALKLRGIELDMTMNAQILKAIELYLQKSGDEKNA